MEPISTDHSPIGPVSLPLRTDDSISQFALWLFRFNQNRYLLATKGECRGKENLLVRVSSMCNFGHLWGSEYCDCAWQLSEAKRLIAQEGAGIIVFAFDQHGKDIGLENHYTVYAEGQKEGLELVVDAYDYCGFCEDLRDYSEVVQILTRYYHLTHIRLLTNSPKRIGDFEKAFASVCRVPIEMPVNEHNRVELTAKKKKLGHLLSFDSSEEAKDIRVYTSSLTRT